MTEGRRVRAHIRRALMARATDLRAPTDTASREQQSRDSRGSVAVAGWTRAALVLCIAFTLALTACAGDTEATQEPTTSSSSSAAAPPTITPSSASPSGWESQYTEVELAKYREALSRWEDYESESAPIWADPNPSAQTLALFRQFFYTPEQMQALLQRNAQVEIKIDGIPTVLSSEASKVSESAVTIRQCIDLTTQAVTQYGAPTEGRPTQPQIRTISMSVPGAGQPFLISEVRAGRSCSA